jgi:hypothetical protein
VTPGAGVAVCADLIVLVCEVTDHYYLAAMCNRRPAPEVMRHYGRLPVQLPPNQPAANRGNMIMELLP